MAGPKAAGNAGGSPQHTPKQDETPADTAADTAEPNPLGALTPKQLNQLLNVWKAQQDERAEAESPGRVDLGHTRELTPAQLTALEKLREPFASDQIAYRPAPWCKKCNDAPDKVCNTGGHTKVECTKCKTRVTTAHTCLGYVGHAGITDRLLSVDPTWDYEFLAEDANGHPVLDQLGGLWIKLTVCGMTRKGYGDAAGKRANTTAMKEIIGDAIRNAAMRFGTGLDLWSKTDLHKESEPEPHPAEQFLDRIKTRHVWESEQWLSGVRREADEAGQIDYEVPGAGGSTLGQIIDGQLAKLADSARIEAELRIEREEQRKAATAQVAAEHGVNQAPPAQPAQGPAAPPAGAPEGRVTAEGIRVEAAQVWLNPDELQNVLTRAQSGGVANEPARPEQTGGPTLGQAMRHQITELRASLQKRAGTAQASDAAHQYADQRDPTDWSDANGYAAG
ncbi:hypothetical protein [Streptomyces scabiei]|uniref:hypothetical protein n=1 Tax=Streptomyces scabiei TaxID=1930 RepID=UPI001B332AA5|nr:hypothetical protein [Streptomyces sp. LBUM 1481]MBP5896396.1 hypothetical protein [Streptomyces sp. LBUM 1481]